MRATPESPRMFESDFIDGFSRTPWWTVPLIWVPGSVGSLLWGVAQGLPVGGAIGVAALFLLLWTLAEYGLHRSFFHWEPQTWWGPKMHFYAHGVHHTWPNDRYRLVMPPAVSLGLGAVVLLFFWLCLGTWAWPAFGGFTFGYMVYDCTHYVLHHGRPRSRFLKRLRAHHMNHHFNSPNRKFGATTWFWDRVFDTM